MPVACDRTLHGYKRETARVLLADPFCTGTEVVSALRALQANIPTDMILITGSIFKHDDPSPPNADGRWPHHAFESNRGRHRHSLQRRCAVQVRLSLPRLVLQIIINRNEKEGRAVLDNARRGLWWCWKHFDASTPCLGRTTTNKLVFRVRLLSGTFWEARHAPSRPLCHFGREFRNIRRVDAAQHTCTHRI